MGVKNQRGIRFGVQVQPQRTTWNNYIETVKHVEDLGFDSVWNADHLLPFAGDPAQPCFETWTTLTAMAMATSRIRIGSLVNGVLYRDPATLAKSAVMVDLVSGGRLEFALGAAWAEREFTAYGLPFPPIGERMTRLEEALDIVKSLWTQPLTNYNGKYYTISDAPCEPKPVQQPHPPIMIGGNGPRTIRIAARHGDIWNGFGKAPELEGRIALLKEECDKIGRDVEEIELSVHPTMSIARTHEEAEAKARAFAASLDTNFDEVRDRWMIGTPDAVRADIQAHIDVGVTHWVFANGAPYDLDGLALFASDVIPGFRKK